MKKFCVPVFLLLMAGCASLTEHTVTIVTVPNARVKLLSHEGKLIADHEVFTAGVVKIPIVVFGPLGRGKIDIDVSAPGFEPRRQQIGILDTRVFVSLEPDAATRSNEREAAEKTAAAWQARYSASAEGYAKLRVGMTWTEVQSLVGQLSTNSTSDGVGGRWDSASTHDGIHRTSVYFRDGRLVRWERAP